MSVDRLSLLLMMMLWFQAEVQKVFREMQRDGDGKIPPSAQPELLGDG